MILIFNFFSMAAAIVMMIALSASPAFADELEDLRNEISALKENVRELEEKYRAHEKSQAHTEEHITHLEEKINSQEESLAHLDKHIVHKEEQPVTLWEGLTVAGGVTMTGQGTAGLDDNIGKDPVDGSFSVDLELSQKVFEKGEIFLRVEAGAGEGITDEVETFWGVNGDAGDNGSFLELTEAWYEHLFLDESLAFTFGKLDLTNYFDMNEAANDERFQFLSDGFVNNIAVEFPDRAAATRLMYRPSRYMDLGIGVQSADADWEDLLDKAFGIAELCLKPEVAGLPGNYRFYGWINGSDHASFSDPDDTDKTGWGFGASLDQGIAENVTLFSRVGYQYGDVYELDLAWSVGAGVKGGFWGRPEDTFGIAWGMAHLSDRFARSGAAPARRADEGHLEAYYKIYVNKYLEISPDLQLITNALGDEDFGDALVFGVRAQATF